jgi:hypothetical protein
MINNYLLFDNINNINNYLSFDNMIDKNHIRKYFFVLFAKLAMANIIQESNFKSENNFKLTKMYKIEINLEELPINSFFKFSYVPYDCFKNNNNDYYLSNLHFSSISEVCRKNFNSGKKFQVKDKDYLEKILKTALYPDIDNINDIKKIIITKDLTILKNDLKNIKEDINNIYKLNKKIISLQQPLKEIQQKYSEIINEIIAYDFLSTE